MASACTLILEIAAGRLLAPHIGVSLYMWTSVIGVVLAGIALGNYVGGIVADRGGSRRVMGRLLVAGGLASLAVLPFATTDLAGLVSRELPVVVRIVLLTGLLFFLPSAVLGMVSPVAVKLTLADVSHAGRVVGRIYAWSTLGSIVGAFFTGFALIPWLGTRPVIFGVGVVLVGLGVLTGGFFRPGWRLGLADAALALLLLLAIGMIHLRGALDGRCYRETSYYCIRVSTETADGHQLQVLTLDKLVHSYNSIDDPTVLHYPYLRTYAELTAYAAQRSPRFNALFIGGGGYTLPRYMEATYPEASLEVAEIDPGVTRTAVERLGLSPRTRVVTYNADAREVVESKQGGATRYDLVFGDAFNDYQIPYHLTTRQFVQKVRNLLTPDGLYLALVIDRMRGGRFMASLVRTLQEVFPHVYVLADVARTMVPKAQTYVVAASAVPLDLDRLRSLPGFEPNYGTSVRIMPADSMAEWLRGARPLVLTDDYAPADNLMAPIFLERGF